MTTTASGANTEQLLRRARTRVSWCLLLVVPGFVVPAMADHACTSPLILNLDDNGRIDTTGEEHWVDFDIDGDGELDRIAWTSFEAEDALLWLDLNDNRLADHGGELFGDSTRLPSGELARNGFEALAVYDRPEQGGDGDGRITALDRIWPRLRLWADFNHDAVSQPEEIHRLTPSAVLAIDLAYEKAQVLDGHGNLHALRGTFVRRVREAGFERIQQELVEDVSFLSEELHQP